MDQGKITKEICLTLEQWVKVRDMLDLCELAAVMFLSATDRMNFSKEYIMPVYDQMPDEVFLAP